MKRELTRIFSKNLERLLYERKKSQADMARYMHVSSATASEWVNGKKMPRADKLQSLANWLSVDLSDLLKENSETSISAIYFTTHKKKTPEGANPSGVSFISLRSSF